MVFYGYYVNEENNIVILNNLIILKDKYMFCFYINIKKSFFCL